MKPSRFTEEQIIGILREQEAGAKTVDVAANTESAGATFDKWKPNMAGSTCRTPSAEGLEDENAKLKIVGPGDARQRMLKDIASKKC